MVPSPKFHDHAVGEFVDESTNATVSGEVPDVGVPSKFAAGAFAAGSTVKTGALDVPVALPNSQSVKAMFLPMRWPASPR